MSQSGLTGKPRRVYCLYCIRATLISKPNQISKQERILPRQFELLAIAKIKPALSGPRFKRTDILYLSFMWRVTKNKQTKTGLNKCGHPKFGLGKSKFPNFQVVFRTTNPIFINPQQLDSA